MGVIMVNDLIKSTNLMSVPSEYAFPAKPEDLNMLIEKEVEQVTIPVIDFSHLSSGSPDQRSKMIEDLRNACQHWGFFTVVNHGVPESLQNELMDLCMNFFDLSPEEKSAYRGNYEVERRSILDLGTNFDTSVESVSFWRDQFRACVHPIFDSPPKPEGLSEILCEYTKRSRDIMKQLLKAIMEGLEIEEDDIENLLEQKSGSQVFSANLYPPCPQPEHAIGLPPHADQGLLTLLIQNDVDGLHIKNKGKLVAVNPIPNSIMVNTGDHMEVCIYNVVVDILSLKNTRVSLVMANGPADETNIY
ncbi:hypothetical protein MKW94_026489 [Papaver nudicaule]|uniref:Fe2OG dioxygenase domain-containing protein n=1 Tax=Papaver nudicaule TaxID=74823 RepID=A0AA41VJB1_PAPNU|nr:hypothetical protein [Papaver nudicaule]MCL7042317.1 hypothetical protein [Papaver nudicaule]